MRLVHTVALVPAVAQKSADGQRCGSQVKNTKVQAFGRLIAQLLRRTGTDGTLCIGSGTEEHHCYHQAKEEKSFVFHTKSSNRKSSHRNLPGPGKKAAVPKEFVKAAGKQAFYFTEQFCPKFCAI